MYYVITDEEEDRVAVWNTDHSLVKAIGEWYGEDRLYEPIDDEEEDETLADLLEALEARVRDHGAPWRTSSLGLRFVSAANADIEDLIERATRTNWSKGCWDYAWAGCTITVARMPSYERDGGGVHSYDKWAAYPEDLEAIVPNLAAYAVQCGYGATGATRVQAIEHLLTRHH